MRIRLFYALMGVLLAFSFVSVSCDDKEDDDKIPLVDENGNTAKISVTVVDYEEVQYEVVAFDGLYMYDENGEIKYDKYEIPKGLTGKTVYMFDSEDFSDKSKALKKVVTDANSTAFFELTEDYFKEDNPVFYFVVYDNDKVIAQGGVNVKRGKETALGITTKGESTGALYYYNLVKKYKLNYIVEENRMNVKARANLVNDNKSKVRVTLPENTVSWYFSFNCVEKSGNNAILGLFSALAKYFDPTKGLASNAIEQIFQPKGSVDCNVYLEDQYGNTLCTLITHLTDGKMEEKQFVSGTDYLVFENPFFARGISINLDVVAMTVEQ